MTTTNKLREKINAACPELLELRFGCKVFEDNEKIRRFEDPDVSNRHLTVFRTDVGRGDIALGQEHTSYITFIERYFTETNVVAIAREKVENNPDRYKILGTPPTFEHLIRTVWFAISQLRTRRRVPHKRIRRIEEELGGMLGFTAGDEELWWELCEEDGVMYDFCKSPLDQSQEVQEALVKLLE